ncbi:hypothetical protein AB7C35_16575 [Bacillus subtilis]|uniref:hypothetical protein n=1 Tax=Bacillus subtilis group TaxID=653685 RepID=UPI00227DBD61|nr:hypothetical protein [Bacillus inaquosorum]MCY8085096.1 hypothetical protein [Bacillus inaquosorum]
MTNNKGDIRQIAGELTIRGIKKPTHLTFHNLTKIDLHIQVECDVENGNWGPNQLNNNNAVTVHSEEVKFGNKANYCVKVWKNDNGSQGQHIGDFNHGVRFNLAGNSDLLEFVIIKVDEDYYLSVYSLREVAEIALLLITGE